MTGTETTVHKDCGGPVIWCVDDTGLCTRCHANHIPLDRTETKPLWPADSGEGLTPVTTTPCPECDDTGMVWTDGCTCGAGPASYCGMHERHCGAEPCPAGCLVRAPSPIPSTTTGDPS